MSLFRLLIIGGILAVLIYMSLAYLGNTDGSSGAENIEFLAPTGSYGQVYDFGHYLLAYNEQKEQADWVAYELDVQQLNLPKNPRPKKFHPDHSIKGGSAYDADYRGSGYTRGHLVPAADMSFDQQALEQTFRFSNISPQISGFNGGVWRELEECTRDWARFYKQLVIVSGPIFEEDFGTIGNTKVVVPSGFFKVLLDLEEPSQKAIAFLIPHAVQDRPLMDFALTVDELEERTQLNFFLLI